MKFKILLVLAFAFIMATACRNNEAASQKPEAELEVTDSLDTQGTPGVFAWDPGDNCKYKGYYDPKKYTAQQVADTYYLCTDGRWLKINPAVPMLPQGYYDFDEDAELQKMKEQYLAQKTRLEELQLVPGAFWENMRQYRLKSIEEYYELAQVWVRGVKTPELLLNSRFSKGCPQYAEWLSADDAILMQGWRSVTEEKARKYNDSAYYYLYDEKSQTADSLANARISLIHYAWYPCALDNRKYAKSEEGAPQDFKKIFDKVESKCLE